jgi:capsular exopolysaccharide synthesis family protein
MATEGRTRPGFREGADWRRPGIERQGLRRYAETLKERLPLVLAVMLVTTAASVGYLLTADKVYEAESEVLVTPVAGEDLPNLGLIPESSDPTRAVETASRLIQNREVAGRVKESLRLPDSPEDLLEQVTAEPVAQSNLVAITATADSPELARDLANGFGRAVVEDRTALLHEQLDQLIPRLRATTAPGVAGASEAARADLIARLETLRAGPDPTLRVQSRATAPDSPASPKPKLSLVAGLLSGLVLGIGGAFLLHAVDPRLRREEQLRELFSLPVLARIPRDTSARTETKGKRRFRIGPRRRMRRALAPGALSPVTREAYRTLRAMLSASRPMTKEGRSVLVTGPSPSEGKTTTAINLASSFALAGNRVILIEADFRRPTVGDAMNVRPAVGIGKVLLGNVPLEDALVPTEPFGESLRLLLVDRADEWLPEVLSLPAAEALLIEAERLADFVVVDSPPLTEVIDALPLAQQVDDVVLVVRLGNSRLSQLERLGDLLSQNNIQPSGFALVGHGTSDQDSYYLSSKRARDWSDGVAAAEAAQARSGLGSEVEPMPAESESQSVRT